MNFKRAKCGISFFGINLEIMCNKGEFRKSEFEKSPYKNKNQKVLNQNYTIYKEIIWIKEF